MNDKDKKLWRDILEYNDKGIATRLEKIPDALEYLAESIRQELGRERPSALDEKRGYWQANVITSVMHSLNWGFVNMMSNVEGAVQDLQNFEAAARKGIKEE